MKPPPADMHETTTISAAISEGISGRRLQRWWFHATAEWDQE